MSKFIIEIVDQENNTFGVSWKREGDHGTPATVLGAEISKFIEHYLIHNGNTTNILEYNERIINDYLAGSREVQEDVSEAVAKAAVQG